jgi:hypothetical protein
MLGALVAGTGASAGSLRLVRFVWSASQMSPSLMQSPAAHDSFPLHFFPQAPQFSPSICMFTQAAPHAVRPVAHCKTHKPAVQVVAQGALHAPQ